MRKRREISHMFSRRNDGSRKYEPREEQAAMGKRSINEAGRRLRLFLLALVAVFAIPVAAASAADKVANPGSFTAEITGGNLALKNNGKEFEVPISEIQPAPTLQGTVTNTGAVTIPSSGVNFPPLEFDLEGEKINVWVLPSGTDWTGTIDPDSGEFSLNARLRIRASGTPLGVDLGSSCYVGEANTGSNIFLNPITTAAIPANGDMPAMEGTRYDPDSGEVTAVNNTVSVPGASGCGPLGLASGTVNDNLGLPSPSGKNQMSLVIKFTQNAPQPPAVARYTVDPQQGRIPFDVDFDASATTSTLGAIDEYRWDFDGDGTVDQTTAEPTVTHTYDTAGVYPTRLTISTQGYETSRSRATITARSIVTTITENPPAFGQARDATFAFESNEPASFECQLSKNGNVVNDWAECATPLSYTDLEDADYNFKVRAVPPGESPGLPDSWDFRVDNIPPVASITSRPPTYYNQTSFPMGFAANEPGASFECRVLQDVPAEDPEAEPAPEPEFEACNNGDIVEWAQVEGPVTFEVRATDRAGNLGSPVSASWELDFTPPTSNISYGPPNPSNAVGGAYSQKCNGNFLECLILPATEVTTVGNTAQRFDFAAVGTEPGVSYICQFNSNAERACASGVQTGTGVSNPTETWSLNELMRRVGDPVQGTNTFRLWAVDRAGNRQSEPTVYTFVFDNIAPNVTALTKPADFTKNVNNTVIFQANEPVQRFECRTVNNTGTGTTAFATGTGAPSGFVTCDPGLLNSTLGWYSVSGQTEGRKGVQVRAVDLAGNTQTTNNTVLNNGGLTTYWTVDNTAPVASFAAGSQQQGSYTTNTTATINLSATDTPINFGTTANNITAQQPAYECSLNGAAFAACTTPINLTGLTPGAKSFRVRVTDQATNVSAIVERNWTVVDASNASVNLSQKPANVIGVRDATYEFSPSSGTSECRIDATEAQNSAGTGWTACTSPKTFSGLADGNHQVEIRASSSAVPVVHNFAVYANAPTMTVGGLPGIARPDKRYTGLGTDSASITLTAPANPAFAPGATTFECRYFKTGEVSGPWEACASPYNVNWDDQDNNSEMVFQARPVSSTGNLGTEQEVKWTIDSVRPEVSLGNPSVATACGRGAVNGPGPVGCVATANSTQPWSITNVTTPRFQAVSTQPVNGAIGFACQLNSNAVQNPCTARTSSFPAGGNPLTVSMGGSRGNSDNLGNAIVQNGSNTFRVWAVDNGGNLSEAPATYTFVHDSVVPGFAITSPTPARTNAGTAEEPLSIDITSTEDMHPSTGFACRLISGGTATTNPTSPGANPPASPATGAIGTWTTCPMDRVDPEDPGSAWDVRSATWSANNLAEGNYVLHIRGWDSVWNVATSTNAAGRPTETDNSVNGRAYVFTIDRTAPVVNITGGPADGATVPQTGGQFTFAPNEAAGQIEKTECRLDPADADDLDTAEWEACSGSFSFSELEDGSHTFQVRSLDTAGNQGNPTTRTWTVDSTMPEITLGSDLNGPVTNQTAVSFNIGVTPVDSTVECRLLAPEGYPAPEESEEPVEEGDEPAEDADEPAEPEFAACTSPVEYTDLIDGEYTFEVKATNTLGTVGEIASRSWTVDTVAPVTTINSGPSAATKNTSASFGFSSDKEGTTFQCQLDDAAPTACTSPVSYTSLGDGNHTVKVRSTDPAGNTSEWVTRSWSVDTVTPVTTINAGPSGTVESRAASIEFSSSKSGSSFECKLDGSDWAACASPVAYTDLANGLHEFRVRATDALGNVGAVAERNWAVDVKECPPGQIGTWPDCSTPVDPTCADSGKVGNYPDCYDPCTAGQIGEPPNCLDPCPEGWTGTPPDCVEPPTAGLLSKPVVKLKSKVKGGKAVKANVTIKNIGGSALTNVKVCVQTKAKAIKGKTSRCKTVASLGAGASKVVSFQLKTKKVKKQLKTPVTAVVTYTVDGAAKKISGKGHVTVLK